MLDRQVAGTSFVRRLEDWGKRAPPEGWSGDVPAATAILDRFLQDAELIQITGKSYRLRGRGADTNQQAASAEPHEPTSAEPATGESKTGQGTDRRLVRKPGSAKKPPKNTSN